MFKKNNLKILLTTSSIALLNISIACAGNAVKESQKSDLLNRVEKLEAKAVTSDKSKINISGFVNRAIQWADNGLKSNLSHISPANLTSNLLIDAVHQYNEDLKISGLVKFEFGSNSTVGSTGEQSLVDVHKSQTNDQASKAISIAQSEITFEHKKYGKLHMGRGLMASTGALYYTDMSGTYVFLHPYSTIGGIGFRNKATGTLYGENPLAAGSTIKPGASVFEHGDGGSIYGKGDRIRYDSPNYYGFNLCTSHSFQNVGNMFDVALKFAAILAKYTIVSQVTWARNHTRDPYNGVNLVTNPGVQTFAQFRGPKFDTTNFALGVLTPFSFSGKEGTGFNFHISAVSRKWKMANQKNGLAMQGKLGYLDQYCALGKTALVASYGQWHAMDVDLSTNIGNNGPITMVGTNWGVGVVQNIESAGTQLYLRYDNFKLKRKGTADRFHPVNIVYAGALVKL